MKKIIFAGLISLFLYGCGSPKDEIIPMDSSKWESELPSKVKDLSDSDKQILMTYLFRAKIAETFGENIILPGTTVGRAIEEQIAFQAKKEAEETARKEAEQRERIERLAAAEKAIETLKNSVNITFISKKNIPQNVRNGLFSNLVVVEVQLENTSEKEIIGVSATIEFYNVFDRQVFSSSFESDTKIAPGSNVTWDGSIKINEYINDHKELWGLEEGKYTVRFVPKQIVFSDGSKVSMPNI